MDAARPPGGDRAPRRPRPGRRGGGQHRRARRTSASSVYAEQGARPRVGSTARGPDRGHGVRVDRPEDLLATGRPDPPRPGGAPGPGRSSCWRTALTMSLDGIDAPVATPGRRRRAGRRQGHPHGVRPPEGAPRGGRAAAARLGARRRPGRRLRPAGGGDRPPGGAGAADLRRRRATSTGCSRSASSAPATPSPRPRAEVPEDALLLVLSGDVPLVRAGDARAP